MSPELDHLSYSSITSYLTCARAWKFRYLDRLQTPATPDLLFGSAWHDTVETWIASGYTVDPATTWLEAWGRRTSGANVEWGSDNPEAMCNDGVRMITYGALLNALRSVPAGQDAQGPLIERKVTLSVPGVPIPVIGFIDMIAADGVPCDFKTAARAWTQDKAEYETQSLFYLAALNQAGQRTPGWAFRHLVFVKTKTPQVQILEHRHNPAQLLWLFGMIREVWRAIEAEVFPPNPTGWRCSPTICDYWGLCRGRYV